MDLLSLGLAPGYVMARSMHTLLFLDPGHFHAALTLRVPQSARRRRDRRLRAGRPRPARLPRADRALQPAPGDAPTRWRPTVVSDGDPLARLIGERRGDVVVVAGRNGGKARTIRRLHEAGFHVLADKPWLVEPTDLEDRAAEPRRAAPGDGDDDGSARRDGPAHEAGGRHARCLRQLLHGRSGHRARGRPSSGEARRRRPAPAPLVVLRRARAGDRGGRHPDAPRRSDAVARRRRRGRGRRGSSAAVGARLVHARALGGVPPHHGRGDVPRRARPVHGRRCARLSLQCRDELSDRGGDGQGGGALGAVCAAGRRGHVSRRGARYPGDGGARTGAGDRRPPAALRRAPGRDRAGAAGARRGRRRLADRAARRRDRARRAGIDRHRRSARAVDRARGALRARAGWAAPGHRRRRVARCARPRARWRSTRSWPRQRPRCRATRADSPLGRRDDVDAVGVHRRAPPTGSAAGAMSAPCGRETKAARAGCAASAGPRRSPPRRRP